MLERQPGNIMRYASRQRQVLQQLTGQPGETDKIKKCIKDRIVNSRQAKSKGYSRDSQAEKSIRVTKPGYKDRKGMKNNSDRPGLCQAGVLTSDLDHICRA